MDSLLFACFEKIPDFRINRRRLHKLVDILGIAVCATLSGADNWQEVVQYARCKKTFLRTFLELPNGIPSHDTFERVFAILDPELVGACFLEWIQLLQVRLGGQVVALDGKTVRRSQDNINGKPPIHMVSAWACRNQLVVGQVKVDSKSNEITALMKLLPCLDIENAMITIDAMGCQKEIAKKIIEQKGNYIFALKGNQGTLQEEVSAFLTDVCKEPKASEYTDFHETVEKGHGRIEVRQCWSSQQVDWLSRYPDWPQLQSIIMIRSERQIRGQNSSEDRFYISGAKLSAKEFLMAIRSHWGVENKLHWCLDISFREDECRVRKGHAAQNLAVLRHICLNLLRRDKTFHGRLKTKRSTSGWDDQYLLQVLKNA